MKKSLLPLALLFLLSACGHARVQLVQTHNPVQNPERVQPTVGTVSEVAALLEPEDVVRVTLFQPVRFEAVVVAVHADEIVLRERISPFRSSWEQGVTVSYPYDHIAILETTKGALALEPDRKLIAQSYAVLMLSSHLLGLWVVGGYH